MFFLSSWFRSKSKKPATALAIAGFEIFFLKSEVRSHDASVTADARPNGHKSIGLRVLQHWCKRGFHYLRFQTAQGRNTISRCLSN
jgi:hypothetical protein